jgi:hypothetical protein
LLKKSSKERQEAESRRVNAMSENSENNLLSSLMERLEQEPDAIIISSVVGSRDLPGAERMVGDIIRDELGIPVPSI